MKSLFWLGNTSISDSFLPLKGKGLGIEAENQPPIQDDEELR
jgi:hypothetical protein